MTEFLFTAKAQRPQRKYSMELAATRALSSLRLCGEFISFGLIELKNHLSIDNHPPPEPI
jgi:hypothetical protein